MVNLDPRQSAVWPEAMPKRLSKLIFFSLNDGFPYDEVYSYSLAGTERSIRLIDLLPGSDDDIVGCQLVGSISLGAEEGKYNVEYEAIYLLLCRDPTDCL